MTPLISPKPESEFQKVKRIMSLPPDFDPNPADLWTDAEFAEYARQEPLPPNNIFQLPSEELIETL
jgi:hypothetical protein